MQTDYTQQQYHEEEVVEEGRRGYLQKSRADDLGHLSTLVRALAGSSMFLHETEKSRASPVALRLPTIKIS